MVAPVNHSARIMVDMINDPNVDAAMIRVATSGAVCRVVLARPERRNALDTATLRALLTALRVADADALVLQAEGPHFCAGADLTEAAALLADPGARAARVALMTELLGLPPLLPRPVIAARRGTAAGAGAALALACDRMVMHPAARLVFPEGAHGLLPAVVAPVLASRLPFALAFDLLATGRALPAGECHARGLADLAEDPEYAAASYALRAAALPPARLGVLKRLLHERADLRGGLAAWLADAGLPA